jgi:diguanylate cyclase (GGDEF)-like protein
MKNETILIVDDTVSNLDILSELLKDYDVIESTNGHEALEIVNDEDVDLILLDIMMPDIDGHEVCQTLKNNPKTEDIPIIFITAKADEESIEKAYNVGGSDYITKPFKTKELLARVKRELKIQKLQNELKLLASTDPMTQLYNRRHFTQLSNQTIDLAQRNNQNISLIMLDIDKFKNINDTYGHQIGDEVIMALSSILKQNSRKGDIVCRYGGEEFVIMLPNSNLDSAYRVAEDIREKVEKFHLEIRKNSQLHFTISLGVSELSIEQENSLDIALKNADDALYKAKESGRNKVCLQDMSL